MYVFRYMLLAVGAIVPLTWGLIRFYPRTDFIQFTVPMLQGATVILVLLTAVSVWKEKELDDRMKAVLMAGFLFVILVPSVFGVGAYIHRTVTSWSGGEVHYHADYEVIVQDEQGNYEQLDLIDPSRFCQRTRHESSYMCKLNDRTGAVEYHEHNDRRIHLEGAFREREDATLAAFFETFGGELSDDRLVYPTNDKVWNLTAAGDRTLKIAVKRGVGGSRHWCMISDRVPEGDRCTSFGSSMPATKPSEYVVTNIQRGPIDVIWIVYDEASPQEVLQDMRDDGRYKQFDIVKSGEGY